MQSQAVQRGPFLFGRGPTLLGASLLVLYEQSEQVL